MKKSELDKRTITIRVDKNKSLLNLTKGMLEYWLQHMKMKRAINDTRKREARIMKQKIKKTKQQQLYCGNVTYTKDELIEQLQRKVEKLGWLDELPISDVSNKCKKEIRELIMNDVKRG